MSPFPFSLHPPPIPSFPLHHPSSRPLHSFSHRTLHFPLLAYPPRHRHPHSHLLRGSTIPCAVTSSNSGSEPGQLQFDCVKRGLGRLLVIAAVCGLVVVRCQRGIAAESSVISSGRSALAGSWPKILQTLQVLREQGLVLAALLSLSAFFSMAETAITTLWPWKVCLLYCQ